MTVQEWLGTENTLGLDIWSKKYQYNNNSNHYCQEEQGMALERKSKQRDDYNNP